jgi:pyruvate/2-oxoglutarate/acetoin dehydrogenase E1 component
MALSRALAGRRIKEEVAEKDYVVPLGKTAVRREGNDVAIIT